MFDPNLGDSTHHWWIHLFFAHIYIPVSRCNPQFLLVESLSGNPQHQFQLLPAREEWGGGVLGSIYRKRSHLRLRNTENLGTCSSVEIHIMCIIYIYIYLIYYDIYIILSIYNYIYIIVRYIIIYIIVIYIYYIVIYIYNYIYIIVIYIIITIYICMIMHELCMIMHVLLLWLSFQLHAWNQWCLCNFKIL